MFVYHIDDLANQGIINIAESELIVKGQILVKGVSISKKLRQMAINICEQEEHAGRVCIAIESPNYLTIWKQKIDEKLHTQKKVETASSIELPTNYETINAELISACQKELSKYIGPIGKFIVDDLVAENPQITSEDFVDLVSEEIPDFSQKKAFRKYFSHILIN
ncbi:hypothetical protein [Geminocystis sp. GBBB08]|uniref:hypothetical protein n=1 Tax=Geminocystis sp. GBBB08 TaxID=2604140 RepID=UPI0027E26113|nr:hypothetical protein [Geminocystis sp. GBBB08]MBL1211186.1 hypothetical protein [Geminocystis sp. GBBB08]